jgi:hypothetical protein
MIKDLAIDLRPNETTRCSIPFAGDLKTSFAGFEGCSSLTFFKP